MKNSNTYGTIAAFFIAFGALITEEFTKMFWAMTALIIISTVIDLMKPKTEGQSRVDWRKKSLPFVVLIVCYLGDYLMGSAPYLVSLLESSVIFSEFAYILKAAAAMGFPVPKAILDRLGNEKPSAVATKIMDTVEDVLDGKEDAETAQKDEKNAE